MILPSIPSEVVGQTGHPDAATKAINSFGLDLLRSQAPDGNTVFSPYSVQSALVMPFAGAAGRTRTEMLATLHYSGHETQIHGSFAALRRQLEDTVAGSTPLARTRPSRAGTAVDAADPDLVLAVANRLYAARGLAFAPAFLKVLAEQHASPLEEVDFAGNSGAAREQINGWVASQTSDRIRDLLPPTALSAGTVMALINAIYFKASWQEQFLPAATRPVPFHVAGRPETVAVPMMTRVGHCGHHRLPEATAMVLPYVGGDLQFLVLMPDQPSGLPALEAALTPSMLARAGQAESTEARITLPRFQIEPPLMKLNDLLIALGMPSAFTKADFRGMVPAGSPEDLNLSNVFHKTIVDVNEQGTVAAGSTAVTVERCMPMAPALEIVVNRPFLFAVQHRPTGACLFLGRVVDPR